MLVELLALNVVELLERSNVTPLGAEEVKVIFRGIRLLLVSVRVTGKLVVPAACVTVKVVGFHVSDGVCALAESFQSANWSTIAITNIVMARFRRCGCDRITGGMLLVLAKAAPAGAL